MLSLTRNVGESVIVGRGPDRIEVIVKRIKDGKVQLGFHGPKRVRVIRSEIDNCHVCEWCDEPIPGKPVVHQGRHFFCSVDCKEDCLAHYDADRE